MFDVLPHLTHGDLPWLREAWEQAAADDRDTSMGGAPPLTWCDYVADVMRSDAEPMALAVRSGERLIGIVPFVRETRGRDDRRIRLAAGGRPFRPQDVFGRHPGTALSTALRWLSSDRDRWDVLELAAPQRVVRTRTALRLAGLSFHDLRTTREGTSRFVVHAQPWWKRLPRRLSHLLDRRLRPTTPHPAPSLSP